VKEQESLSSTKKQEIKIGVWDRIINPIKDAGVAVTSLHILYMPATRLGIIHGAQTAGISPAEVEIFYNVAISGLFGKRGIEFLKRVGRWQKWGGPKDAVEDKRPENFRISQVIETLTKPVSPELRLKVNNDPLYRLTASSQTAKLEKEPYSLQTDPPTPLVGSKELAVLTNPSPLSFYPLINSRTLASLTPEQAGELDSRSSALIRAAMEIFDPEKRSRPASDSLRSQIAGMITKIYSHSPYMTEPIAVLAHETKALISSLAWLSCIEGSPPVLQAAAEAGEQVLEHWINLKVKTRGKSGECPMEHISNEEALLVAKCLVSISMQSIPEARKKANEAITRLKIENTKLLRDPKLKAVGDEIMKILELPSSFGGIGRNLNRILGLFNGIGTSPPVEIDLTTGTISLILPAKENAFSEKQLDEAVCLLAMKFPLIRNLAIRNKEGETIFTMSMDQFYRDRLIERGNIFYKPEQIPEWLKEERRLYQARESLSQFSEGLREGLSQEKLAKLFDKFYELASKILEIKVTSENIVPNEIAETQDIINLFLEKGQEIPRETNKFVIAFVGLQLTRELLEENQGRAFSDSEKKIYGRLKDLMGILLAPTLEILWEEPSEKPVGKLLDSSYLTP